MNEECEELVNEIASLSNQLYLKEIKLREAIKGLEWLRNFVKDPLVKQVVETTLETLR